MTPISIRSLSLQDDGPCIGILIRPPRPKLIAIGNSGKNEVPEQHIRALIDTGASNSAISKTVLEEMGFISRDTAVYMTPDGPRQFELFRVQIEILVKPSDGDKGVFDLTLPAANLEGQPVMALIGRDILQFTHFTYRGPDNAFDLRFVHPEL